MKFLGRSKTISAAPAQPPIIGRLTSQEQELNVPIHYPKNALKQHFSKPAPKPVMIDNGSFAYCIVGVGSPTNSNVLHLAIMDPHIKQGARMIKGSDAQHVGVYTITLDNEGSQTHVNNFKIKELFPAASEEAIQFLHPYCNLESLQRLSFNNVGTDGPKNDWMVLFPASSC